MTLSPGGRYPEPQSIPPGVLRFTLVSIAAAAGVGLLITAWGATQVALGPGGPEEGAEYAVTLGPTFVIVTAMFSVAPIGAAIVSGLLARRTRSMALRCVALASAIFTTTFVMLAYLTALPVSGDQWGPALTFAAIATVVLTASAVLPWRGGFASRRA